MTRAALAVGFVAMLVAGAAGDRAFREGRFEEAAAEYRRVLERRPSAALRYNLGATLLALGRYDEARGLLERAAAEAGDADPRVAQPASYNAGNADLEPAFRAAASAAQADALRRAVERYRQALRLDPGDHDAKWNLELAQRLLARQQPEGGAGGDAPEPRGGEADEPTPARRDGVPEPAGAGAGAGMSRAEAERLLEAAAQRDSELQRQKLRRAEPPPAGVRGW